MLQWNFEKFLIDQQGHVVHRWASVTTPETIDVEVAKLLANAVDNTPGPSTEASSSTA